MTYGESFQDKTIIENYMVSNINLLSEFREYLKERANLEKKYSKESADLIQKYSQRFEKRSRQSICISPGGPNPLSVSPSMADAGSLSTINESEASPTSPVSPTDMNNKDAYTYIIAWKSILNQMKSVNESRNKFSQKLSDLVIDKLKTLISIRDDERKNNLQNLKNINSELEKLANEKINSRKKYVETCDLMSNHKKKLLTKQDSSLDTDKSNDKGMKKIEKSIESTQIEMDNKKNLYILNLQALNTLRKKITNEYVPEIFNNLQSSQEATIGAFQHYCQDYIKLEQDLTDEIKNSFSSALIDINAIDPSGDNILFEKENKRDWVPVEDEKFNSINNDVAEFALTNKSTILLSTLKDNMENQMIIDQEKYNSLKNQYDQIIKAYTSYINNPTSVDNKNMIEELLKLWNEVHLAEIPIVINDAKIQAISDAVGEDLQVNEHKFKTVMFINATVCDHCQEKIRGKALQCKTCNFVCHNKCQSDVPERCTGVKMDRKALRVNKIGDNPNHGRNFSINRSISVDSSENCPTPTTINASSPLAILQNNEQEEVSSPVILEHQEDYSNDTVEDTRNNVETNDEINNQEPVENEASSPTSTLMCAIFEYQPQNDDEVSLSLNDRVEIIESEADGWVKVKTDHGEGFVPSTYIAPVKKAIYDFQPEKDDEIPLHEGESVVVLGQEDEGWLKIKKGSLEGIVPESYIDM